MGPQEGCKVCASFPSSPWKLTVELGKFILIQSALTTVKTCLAYETRGNPRGTARGCQTLPAKVGVQARCLIDIHARACAVRNMTSNPRVATRVLLMPCATDIKHPALGETHVVDTQRRTRPSDTGELQEIQGHKLSIRHDTGEHDSVWAQGVCRAPVIVGVCG